MSIFMCGWVRVCMHYHVYVCVLMIMYVSMFVRALRIREHAPLIVRVCALCFLCYAYYDVIECESISLYE